MHTHRNKGHGAEDGAALDHVPDVPQLLLQGADGGHAVVVFWCGLYVHYLCVYYVYARFWMWVWVCGVVCMCA